MVGVCGMVHSQPQYLPSIRAPPPTVEELDVVKYLGKWKQVSNKQWIFFKEIPACGGPQEFFLSKDFC